jgi:hypothetical protein
VVVKASASPINSAESATRLRMLVIPLCIGKSGLRPFFGLWLRCRPQKAWFLRPAQQPAGARKLTAQVCAS